MVYVIGGLVGMSVALLVIGLSEALPGPRGEAVARRLQRIRDSPIGDFDPAESPRSRLSGNLAARLEALGNRFLAGRTNAEAQRAILGQAGYRRANALPLFLAIRAVLMVALALLTLLILTLSEAQSLLALFAFPYVIVVGWLGPRYWVRRKATVRQRALQRALPDTLDLLVVCVEAGLGLNQAVVRVAREIEPVSPVMASELSLLNLEIRAGTPRDEAFRHLGERTGVEDLRSLASMLIQADRFGTSVSQALRVQAETLRTKRRQRAEEAAAKTTIKLVFPLVLFIFPALFVVVLGPAVISMIRQLSGLQ